MAGDMVVALGRVTVDGGTLFAQNSSGPPDRPLLLCLHRGQEHALGERVRIGGLELAQARQTFTVLGSQPAGAWGYRQGVNEHGVAIGSVGLRTKLTADVPGMPGPALVRLALQRSRTAGHAVDLVTDLVERHGQGEDDEDAALLIADPGEAFFIETAGNHWVLQEIGQVRAASSVSTIHQDWVRISRGLAGQVIARGWWPSDGSKLDFGAAVAPDPVGRDSGLRRWGRATYLLEQQSGHIDVPFLRRVLSDHYEGMQGERDPLSNEVGPLPLCQHDLEHTTLLSLVASLTSDPQRPVVAWCTFGPPCVGVYVPLLLRGDLPTALTSDTVARRALRLHEQLRGEPSRMAEVCETFDRLQAVFDQEAEAFVAEARALNVGDDGDLPRRASQFMQRCLDRYIEALDGMLRRVYELV
jgi:dipeptidase